MRKKKKKKKKRKKKVMHVFNNSKRVLKFFSFDIVRRLKIGERNMSFFWPAKFYFYFFLLSVVPLAVKSSFTYLNSSRAKLG